MSLLAWEELSFELVDDDVSAGAELVTVPGEYSGQ